MIVPNNLNLGPVIPQDLNAANVGLDVDVTNPVNITLTGAPITSATASAAVSPFAPNPGPGEAKGSTYYFNSFNFNNLASTLTINSTDPAAEPIIYFDEHTLTTTIQGQNNLTIAVATEFIVKDPAWTKVQAINIGNLTNSRYNFATDISDLTLYPGGSPEVMDAQPIANINFSGANSSYVVSNESTNDATFIATVPIVPAQDLWGQLGVYFFNMKSC